MMVRAALGHVALDRRDDIVVDIIDIDDAGARSAARRTHRDAFVFAQTAGSGSPHRARTLLQVRVRPSRALGQMLTRVHARRMNP